MKGLFIKNIELELREIPDGKVDYTVADSIGLENPYIGVSINKTIYSRMDIVENGKERKHYFVKLDDRELFSDLANITDAYIGTLVEKRTQEIKKFMELAMEHEIDKIRCMRWWKRLFNQF